jgi:hypothetical protein
MKTVARSNTVFDIYAFRFQKDLMLVGDTPGTSSTVGKEYDRDAVPQAHLGEFSPTF